MVVVIVVLGGAALLNARSWFWFARIRQIGQTLGGAVVMVLLGTVVPPLQLIGLVQYRRNHLSYLMYRRSGAI